jgi:uncharacterized protein (TIGR04141 family)
MDAVSINYGGGQSKVEFCDVFSRDRILLHVKRYSGSSVLSHLFAQGFTSPSLLIGEAEFRKLLNAKLPKSHRLPDPDKRPVAADYEIAYGIASRSTGTLILPFFSRVILRSTLRNLRNLGFRMTCTKIQVTN